MGQGIALGVTGLGGKQLHYYADAWGLTLALTKRLLGRENKHLLFVWKAQDYRHENEPRVITFTSRVGMSVNTILAVWESIASFAGTFKAFCFFLRVSCVYQRCIVDILDDDTSRWQIPGHVLVIVIPPRSYMWRCPQTNLLLIVACCCFNSVVPVLCKHPLNPTPTHTPAHTHINTILQCHVVSHWCCSWRGVTWLLTSQSLGD